MRVLTFLLLEVLLSPISVTSFILLQLWAITTSKQQKTSTTALAPLAFRWLLHVQGIRPDETTHHLVQNLTALNSALCWSSVGPTLFAASLTGYTPSFLNVSPVGQESIFNMFNTRSLFFDKALVQNLTTAKQIVLLGAGYDTRLFKFCLDQGLDQKLSLFEVDQAATQQAKVKALRKSGRDLAEVNFISVDFNEEDWADSLQQAGFRSGEASFFLWEGVTYYLTEPVVKETLMKVSKISGKGSAIAFDVFSSSFIAASNEWQWIQPAINFLDLIGEPLRFGLNLQDTASISQLLSGTDFQLQTLQLMGSSNQSAFSGLILARTKLD